jgi:hypothetical protein
MCKKCGCNTCESIRGPLLTEGKVKSLLSEGLQYHIDKKIPLFETVYRIGSDKHLALIKEARKMYSRNIIDLCEDDEALIKTHLGEFALYEQTSTVSKRRAGAELKQKLKGVRSDGFGKYDATIYGLDSDGKRVELKSLNDLNKFDKFELAEGESVPLDLPMLEQTYSGFRRGEPEDPDSIPFKPTGSVSEFREDLKALFGKFKGDLKNPEFIKGVAQIMVNWKSLLRSQLDEAKKKKKKEKKDPPLNKPKRGGSKAYYVYVRDPKTKKIKKVSFGSGGLRAKIKNKEARNAFAARHNCKNKKDRTKAGYWSCNLPRYAPALGLGAKMNTFW